MTMFNAGLDQLKDIATGDFRWMLLRGNGYTFNKDHAIVSALAPGTNEVTASGYSRQTLTGGARTVDATNDRITYVADDPSFGTIAAGQTVTAVVLYRHITMDTDSIPVAYYAITGTATNALTPFVVTFTSHVIATASEA